MFDGSEHFYPTFQRAILRLASLKGGLVLDIGTPCPFRKELARFERDFDGVRVMTLDYPGTWDKPGDWKADVGGDIGYLPFKTASVDGVICKDVLEHVPDPFAAVSEIHRVLKPGGLAYLAVPGLHPYHAGGVKGAHDYWRFTGEGVEKLCSKFASTQVRPAGGVVFVARAYAGRPGRVLFHRRLSRLWNFVDRVIPTREFTYVWMIELQR